MKPTPKFKCERCSMRARYESNPRSLLGRFWRWHIRFCPGWRAYTRSLPDEERQKLAARYMTAR